MSAHFFEREFQVFAVPAKSLTCAQERLEILLEWLNEIGLGMDEKTDPHIMRDYIDRLMAHVDAYGLERTKHKVMELQKRSKRKHVGFELFRD